MIKKKLLIIHPIIAPYRVDMVNELNRHFDVKLCLTKENIFQQLDLKKLYEEQLSVVPNFILSNKKIKVIHVLSQIRGIIETFKPDIVLVSEFGVVTWQVILYRLVHFTRYKIVNMVDESYDMVTYNHYFSRSHKIAQRLTVPLVDQVINVEPRVAEWYKRNYGKGVYFPIISDDDKFRERLQKSLPVSEEYVKKYHLQGKKVLLFVGRLSPEKNIPTAIKAFLQAKVPNSVFIIIGDGPEKEKLAHLVGDERSILMIGKHEGEALIAWYNVAQVHILPSTQEAFGAVTNEALMAGCWGLISELAGSSCLVENTINGNTYSPSDVETIIKLIKSAFSVVPPIDVPLKVKPNRMKILFREYISHLVKAM